MKFILQTYRHLFLILAVGFVFSVSAQDYPNRPIKIIVPYPPGGVTDIATRFVAVKLGESFGQPVIVENTWQRIVDMAESLYIALDEEYKISAKNDVSSMLILMSSVIKSAKKRL